MQLVYQNTIKNPVTIEGIGLHSGKPSKIRIVPSDLNQKIIFKRVDLQSNNLIEANFKNVSSAKLCTTLENKHGVKVSTVEHLLAAIYISEIDSAVIEIDSEEVPILDGSARDFLKALKKSGLRTLNNKRKYLRLLNKVELLDGQRRINIMPLENSLEVDFQLNYQNKLIGDQRNVVNFQTDGLEDIVNSRTFCLFEDIEKIKKAGLAKGGSLENALVVSNEKVMNEGGLRNAKEFVNHKILDLAGDFLLSGYRVTGKVICYQGGHQLSNMFLRKILNTSNSFEIFTLKDSVVSKKINLNQQIKFAVSA
tara:strand:+ start:226 stop:1152 length:927 start_codon:yes stop_codon:yes gene_type:complete